MQRDIAKKFEEVVISFFEHTPHPAHIQVSETTVQVPMMSGPIVRAAMLKGLNEIFYKDLCGNPDDMFEPETMKEINGILDRYRERKAAAQSQIIMPGGGTPPPRGGSGLILP